MESPKLHIRHVMLWEFKQGNSAKTTAEKICRVYGEGLITDRAVRNWFVKFRFGDMTLKDESRAGRSTDFDDNLLKAALEQTPHQYVQQLQRVQEKFREKRPVLANRKNVILLLNDARPHTEKVSQQKILEFGWSILPNLPYSPDLAPTDSTTFSVPYKQFLME
ncbi:histone-lysine N-methyltransferase SETMAR [Trichonephila inaurata madagascariensis]|uniref:Histone-lysine N-methyltransferase SETMAR n=1 Tax=Trichonephila inaurata madagascariensis TaxID=2747483 RepID=A0A8X6YKD5_9ARAC|nr:histone-lysine N-methyltransferase SETMAR [Trichonephila inaurata madagascariensis]